MTPNERRLHNLRESFSAVSEASLGEKNAGGGLKSGDDGGNFDDMERRVARLEAHFEHISETLKEIKAGITSLSAQVTAVDKTVSTLEERSKHTPSKLFVAACVGAGLVALAALVAMLRNTGAIPGAS